MALEKIRNANHIFWAFIGFSIVSCAILSYLRISNRVLFPMGTPEFAFIIMLFTYALVYVTIAVTIRDEEAKVRNLIFMGSATVLVSLSSNPKLVVAGIVVIFALSLFAILNLIYAKGSEKVKEFLDTKITNYEITAIIAAILAGISIYDGALVVRMAVISSYRISSSSTPYAPIMFISALIALIFGFIGVIRVLRDIYRVIEDHLRRKKKKLPLRAHRAMRYCIAGFKYSLIGLIGVFWILPFYWMIITSFKPETQVFKSMWLIAHPTLQNYKIILFSSILFGNLKVSFLLAHALICAGLIVGIGCYITSKFIKRYEVRWKVLEVGILIFMVLFVIALVGIYLPIKSLCKVMFTFPVNFPLFFINSVIVAGSITAIQLLTSILGGYAFAKKRFRAKEKFFSFYVAMMMMPFPAVMVAQYLLIVWMGRSINPNLGIGSYFAFIFPGIASAYSVFFMRQAFEMVPDSMIEAAKIDGASELQTLFKIVLPSIKASVVALTLFIFQFNWGNYLWQLLVASSPKMYTLPVGLAILQQHEQIHYGILMAGATISTLPLLAFFIAIQKYFAESIFGGAVKG